MSAPPPVTYFDDDYNWDDLSTPGNDFMKAVTSHPLPPSSDAAGPKTAWNSFHANHRSATFFRPKRYLSAEFPTAMAMLDSHSTPKIMLEVGCGAGAALFPVLAMSERARTESGSGRGGVKCVAIDVSETAVELLREQKEYEGVKEYVESHVCDIAREPAPVDESSVDVVFLIFCLSAIEPELFPSALKNLHASMKPGGLLCFRDYGKFDMTMLRFSPSQWRGGTTFQRGDGTLSSFFEVSEVERMFQEAGFVVEECKYALVENVNRKTGARLKRCFLHALLRKGMNE
ncbi:hypothetical protein TrVE_jg12550 [Triparma verrucosa]|uniref:tRNA N(3)-methylcytidine methyltransferase n=1 Tax=Triparma verrucosa TaxID=1606542 RepID=A0A9W7ELM8_9STRA|nr:hypothetical protein TrVE_jg12550 [Triparma verrucosa]